MASTLSQRQRLELKTNLGFTFDLKKKASKITPRGPTNNLAGSAKAVLHYNGGIFSGSREIAIALAGTDTVPLTSSTKRTYRFPPLYSTK